MQDQNEVQDQIIDELNEIRSQAAEPETYETRALSCENALRDSEDFFHGIFKRHSSVMLLIEPMTGQILDANKAAESFYGYTMSQFRSMSIQEINLLAPDELAHKLILALENKRHHFIFQHRLASGEVRTVEEHSTPIERGGRMALFSIIHNIDELKRAEEGTRESEDRLRKLIKLAPLPLCFVNKQGVLTYCNDRFFQMFGYTPDDIPTLKEWWKLACPDERYRRWVVDTWEASVKRAAEENTDSEPLECKVTCKNGAKLVVVISGITIEDNLLATFIDITQRKRYMEGLLRIRDAIDGASDSIAMATLEGGHFYQNSAFCHLFGYTIEDMKGSQNVFRACKDHNIARMLFEKIKRGERWSGEIEMLTKDRRCRPLHVRVDPIRDDQGEITGLIEVHTDTTKSGTAQQALNSHYGALVETQRRLATLFENAPDCMFIKDRQLRYIEVNRAVGNFLGMSRSEILGKNDSDLFREEYHRHTSDIEFRILQDQVIENQETLSWKRRYTNWSIMRFPLKDTSGEVNGICGIAREVYDQAYEAPDSLVDTDEALYPSLAMRLTLAKAAIASETSASILLTGETGTGKDHLARYIHDSSAHILGPLIVVNCAAIPSELAESELFGHEAGSFTGAYRKKRGLMELAEGGTLLLNEIGELSLALQAKLFSFLDTFSFTRVGGEKQIKANIRLIAATSKDLDEEIFEGRFRQETLLSLECLPYPCPSAS